MKVALFCETFHGIFFEEYFKIYTTDTEEIYWFQYFCFIHVLSKIRFACKISIIHIEKDDEERHKKRNKQKIHISTRFTALYILTFSF